MKTELMMEKCDGPNNDERKRHSEEGEKNERKKRSEEGEKNERKRHSEEGEKNERKRHSEEGEKNKRKRPSEEGEKNERKKRSRKDGKGMVEVKNEKSQRKGHHHHSSNNRSSNSVKYDRKNRDRGKGLEKHESKHNREEGKKRRNRNNDELDCQSRSGLKENKSDEWSPRVNMELGLDRWIPRVEKHDMECGYKADKSQGSDNAEADNMKKSPTPTLSEVENSTKYDSRVYKKLKIASGLKEYPSLESWLRILAS